MSQGSDDELDRLSSESSLFEEEHFSSQYAILRTIGQGSHDKIMLGEHRLTGVPVAVKILTKKKKWCKPVLTEKKKWCEPMLTEVDIMKMLDHPNLISLIQVIRSENRTYVIMELVKGLQLFEIIQQTGGLQEDEAREIFRQILSAVGYCHKHGVVHRDLKPDNILLTEDGEVKIIDFGLSTQVKPGQKLNRYCGSFAFGAPELYLREPYDGPMVDIWALGVVLYYMVVGKLPFEASSLLRLQRKIVSGTFYAPRWLSEDLCHLISLLLTVDPRCRPSVNQLRYHPWLVKDKEDMIPAWDWEEIIPSPPDPDIVQAMKHLGFDDQNVRYSVTHRLFDESMATYRLLQSQAYTENGPTTHGQPINPGVTPFPSREDPATFPPSPRRRRSEPALNKLLWYSCSEKDWGSHTDQRRHSSAAGPTMPLDRPVKRAPMDSTMSLKMRSAPSCLTTACSDEGRTENTPSHSSSLEGRSLPSREDSSQGQPPSHGSSLEGRSLPSRADSSQGPPPSHSSSLERLSLPSRADSSQGQPPSHSSLEGRSLPSRADSSQGQPPSHDSSLEGRSLPSGADSSQGQRRGFRRWTARIGNCIRRLCCCLPSARRPRLGQNRVHPEN